MSFDLPLGSWGPGSRSAWRLTAGQLNPDWPSIVASRRELVYGERLDAVSQESETLGEKHNTCRTPTAPERVSTPWLGQDCRRLAEKLGEFWPVSFAFTFKIHITINTLNAM